MVLLRALWFLPTLPHGMAIVESGQYQLKSNQDGYNKILDYKKIKIRVTLTSYPRSPPPSSLEGFFDGTLVLNGKIVAGLEI